SSSGCCCINYLWEITLSYEPKQLSEATRSTSVLTPPSLRLFCSLIFLYVFDFSSHWWLDFVLQGDENIGAGPLAYPVLMASLSVGFCTWWCRSETTHGAHL
ncbi:hypothetical protein MKW98_008807, partial [Papaver atlanticum]